MGLHKIIFFLKINIIHYCAFIIHTMDCPILCDFRFCFPVYCHVLCEVCQHLSVDPMIIQPILEELKSSLDSCFSTEVAGLPLVLKETENLEILRSTVYSLERSKYIPSLGFDGKIFSSHLPMPESVFKRKQQNEMFCLLILFFFKRQ